MAVPADPWQRQFRRRTKQPSATANPRNPAYGAGTGWGASAPWQPSNTGLGGYNPGDDNWFKWDPSPEEAAAFPKNDPNAGLFGPPAAGGGQRSITFGGEPAYRGILDRYTADWRARLNAGLGAMRQSTLSGQRGMINRLGVRDPAAMMAALKAKGVTGITLADLQKAAENPFSDLMALDKRARGGRSTLSANLGARGGVRSGAATKGVTDIENERARAEALATEEALTGIGSSQSQLDNWAREQEDQLFQRSFDLEQQLAQMYQPRTAFWDDQYGGYVHGGYVYDQSGNVIGTV